MKDHAVTLLRKLEQYTKTDMVYLTSGGFWLGVGQITASVSAFLLAIAFANLLSPETYGTYKFVLSVVGILGIPTLGGINTALSQAISRDIEGVFIHGLFTKIRWGLAGTIGSLVLATYYYINGNTTLTLAFIIVAPFIPLFETLGIYSVYLQGKRLFHQSTVNYVIMRIVYVTALIGAAFLTNNVLLVIFTYFVSLTAINFILLLKTLKTSPPNSNTEDGIMRYGKHLSLIGVVGKIGSYLDALLLFHYLGPIYVAQYAFARAPIDQITATYKNIPLLALPKLSNRLIPSIHELLPTRLLQLLLIGIFIGISYALIAPIVFPIIFPIYLDSVIYSQLLAVTLIIQLPLSFLGTAIQSRLNTTPTSWLYWRTVPQIIYIAAILILIPLYGILGAIIGTIMLSIMRFVLLLIQWYAFVRRV